jgi:RimJ/RimL family protein N-acetyltransferase
MTSGLHWAVVPMTDENAAAMYAWRYEGEFAFYDRDESDVAEVLDPASGYWALTADGAFAGFCSFGADGQVPGGTYDDGAIDVGIGLSPAHVGRGLGAGAVAAIKAHAADRWPGVDLRVTIASFNHRSRRTFEKAGFVPEHAEFAGPAGDLFRQFRLVRSS